MILDPQILQYVLLALLFWLIILTVFLIRSILHYSKLTKNITKKDLKTVLNQILSRVDANQKDTKDLEQVLSEVQKTIKTHIQKIGFVRFNPFPQTGGDQSFSLSLLDKKDNGLVLSSLHSRDTTRLYAKTIEKGKTVGAKLSEEEEKAIKNAK